MQEADKSTGSSLDALNLRITSPDDVFSDEDIKSMVKKNYGLTIMSVKPLNGYEDRNYYVKVEAVHNNDHIKNVYDNGYLLKIINAYDSKTRDFTLGQKLQMDHLNMHSSIKCQEEIQTVDGKIFSEFILDKNGKVQTHLVSLRTYIPGVVVNDVTLTESLAYDLGTLTAEVCKGLQDFKFPFYDNFKPGWDLDNLLKVREALPAVKDANQKRIAEDVLNTFESKVIPRLGEYRKGQTHGDLNEQNILVEKTEKGTHVCGLIDFQESAFTSCIYDLAYAIAYMTMLPTAEVPTIDVGGHMLAGYQSVLAVNQAERDTLKIVVAGRMVMSLVYGAYFHSLNPTNDYLLITSRVGWSKLGQFWETADETMVKRWDEIINSYSS